ncbi:COMMD3 [Acanthosepion pharaonis]|uniref:COMM domain-containing protein 3 n=1 Tax=Acanthosepion pharaonis TaxID=158019 RepID=A0A812E9D1_ACAPH|nr:COMMD3 [Sepia pharaonis]
MEVSTNVLQGITAANNNENVPDDCFPALVTSACQGILNQSPHIDPRLRKLDQDVLKETLASFALFISEAAKHDTDVQSLMSLLEECNFSKDRIKTFVSVFCKNKPFLQTLLANTHESLPHVLGVKWRLDYYIKSNHLEKTHQPVYLLSLVTEIPGESELQELNFSCTLEQLQMLVGKLRDASKCVERFAQL